MEEDVDPVDEARVALLRFVGAWDYEGWYEDPGVPRKEVIGIAAGTLDNGYFVVLDTARVLTTGGEEDAVSGTILFSAEPGIGLMLTAWSEESPSVHRFRGSTEADGSYFVFDELPPVTGRDPLRVAVRFESDDRWVAEFSRPASGSDAVTASHTFVRAGSEEA